MGRGEEHHEDRGVMLGALHREYGSCVGGEMSGKERFKFTRLGATSYLSRFTSRYATIWGFLVFFLLSHVNLALGSLY